MTVKLITVTHEGGSSGVNTRASFCCTNLTLHGVAVAKLLAG
jgi:hypothetical protein